MRRTLVAAATLLACAPAGVASASSVLVLDGGRVVREQDRFVGLAQASERVRATPPARAAEGGPSIPEVLKELVASGQISQADHDERLENYNAVRAIRNALKGTPARELTAQINLLQGFARRGQLTASRIPLLWMQLERNAEWWIEGTVPGAGTRIRFDRSRILWQYFPGQGLQFHPLANFGRLSGLINGGYPENARQFADELMPLAADRGGALAWEYYFYFGGGAPPWTSGLSQGTALIAFSSMFRKLGTPIHAEVIRQALRLYEIPYPTGVRLGTKRGAHYLEYSFAPKLRIINGFIQALNGLRDASIAINDAGARRLYNAGERQARFELPKYDTGYWSRYDNSKGSLSPLNYHVLLRDFLVGLCERSKRAIYCSTATRFTRYLRNGPPYPPKPPKKKKKPKQG